MSMIPDFTLRIPGTKLGTSGDTSGRFQRLGDDERAASLVQPSKDLRQTKRGTLSARIPADPLEEGASTGKSLVGDIVFPIPIHTTIAWSVGVMELESASIRCP